MTGINFGTLSLTYNLILSPIVGLTYYSKSQEWKISVDWGSRIVVKVYLALMPNLTSPIFLTLRMRSIKFYVTFFTDVFLIYSKLSVFEREMYIEYE